MKSVFALTSSASSSLRDVKLFATAEAAQEELAKMADERRYKLGVNNLELKENKLSYNFGWEEKKVCFSIVELDVSGE